MAAGDPQIDVAASVGCYCETEEAGRRIAGEILRLRAAPLTVRVNCKGVLSFSPAFFQGLLEGLTEPETMPVGGVKVVWEDPSLRHLIALP